MSNTTLFALLSATFATACGAVASDDVPPTGTGGPAESRDLGAIGIGPTTAVPPESPLVIDTPRAATTARSLFAFSVQDHARMVALVGGGAEPQVDVVEQRIVTRTDAPVALDISMAPPTGHYARVIASDAIRDQYQVTDHVLCTYDNGSGPFSTFDPKCATVAPVPTMTQANGDITAARWRLWVMDEESGAAVDGCSAIGTELSCTLPGRAVASYRIVGSVDGVAELWGGTSAAGVGSLGGNDFTGTTAPQYQCWDWMVSGGSTYCQVYWKFTRYTAIDNAAIELDPIHIELGADGVTSAGDSPALDWEGGNDDLPGATY